MGSTDSHIKQPSTDKYRVSAAAHSIKDREVSKTEETPSFGGANI